VGLALVDFLWSLFDHRILGAINDFIDHNSVPILNAVRPFLIWIVSNPFALLIAAVSVIIIHAFVSSRHEPQADEAQSDYLSVIELPPITLKQEANPHIDLKPQMKQEANPHIEFKPQIHIHPPTGVQNVREPTQKTKTPKPIPEPPSHNILFLGGHHYNPDKHGLLGGIRESDMIRMVLAEFRNKHIVGSTVGHVYDVKAGITYKDSDGKELRYVSPGQWLMRNEDTVELKSGAESESVILAVYNYDDKRWETSKVVHNAHWDGHFYTQDTRPLPFGVIVADVALLEKDGTALRGGTVTFELKQNGEFDVR
jgi:hypothetical protein